MADEKLATKEPSGNAPGFTPAPWAIASISQDTGAIGIGKDRILIAEVCNGYSFMDVVTGRRPRTQWANANLIVEAPNLYAMLLGERMTIDALLQRLGSSEDERRQSLAPIDALLAKARGETE